MASGQPRGIRADEIAKTSAAVAPDDLVLVGRIRAGELAAFEALFDRYYANLVRFARSLVRARDEAEDVVQDVFLRVWAGRATWEIPTGTVAAYLFAAVRNRALNRERHARVVRRWAAEDGNGPIVGAALLRPAVWQSDERVETLELATMVRDAIATLPERCRTTYLLSREHGLSYPEIARTMGTSVHTVNAQMGRAFLALRRAVARWRGR